MTLSATTAGGGGRCRFEITAKILKPLSAEQQRTVIRLLKKLT
jgi:hypothetical protein